MWNNFERGTEKEKRMEEQAELQKNNKLTEIKESRTITGRL